MTGDEVKSVSFIEESTELDCELFQATEWHLIMW